MNVTSITVEGLRPLKETDGHCAVVMFEDEQQQFSAFHCTLHETSELSEDALKVAMVEDAIRQAKRMPEIRSGLQELVFLTPMNRAA